MISTTASLQQLSVKYFLPSIKLSQKRIFPSFFWFKSINFFYLFQRILKLKLKIQNYFEAEKKKRLI